MSPKRKTSPKMPTDVARARSDYRCAARKMADFFELSGDEETAQALRDAMELATEKFDALRSKVGADPTKNVK